MTEIQGLIVKRDELLSETREIETTCEGIENENNAKLVRKLNSERLQLNTQKMEVQAKLNLIQSKLSDINSEITKLSVKGIDRIFEAIKNQRWYFFKNKTKVLLDRNTGIMWNNPRYIKYLKDDGNSFSCSEAEQKASEIIDGFKGWKIVNKIQFDKISYPKSDFPYYTGPNYQIFGYSGVIMDWGNNNHIDSYWTDYDYAGMKRRDSGVFLIYNDCLVQKSDYENNVSLDNSSYTEKERLLFTLDLFVKNELLPVFKDDKITQLYKKIYFEKPALLKQLQEVQQQIEKQQMRTLLSSQFDYTDLLAKYDVNAINDSIIKYFHAIQQWTCELMDKLDDYEQEKESVIREFNLISLKLSKKYEDNPHLTNEENSMLSERQQYFHKMFSLGMHNVKYKILAVKKQADDLEYRIDEINNGEDAIHKLALLEKEERASFSFVAENTAEIIKNALLKIEYFQDHHQFVMAAIDTWEKWSENYRVFKTTYREDLKSTCEDDSVEEKIWSQWYEDWRKIRFNIEQKIQPIIEHGLRCSMPTVTETKESIPELLIAALTEYKSNIDKFFMEERKGIYQEVVLNGGGELQDKFATEKKLYSCTVSLQDTLEKIIFNCANAEDRVFILKWANSLLDIQIDEILDFVADKDLQKISSTILSEFATLKQKNYDTYLADAKAYSEEKSRREKEYNSLIFKMRKELTR